ncbi:unnamed protein product [Schistocephalus solidus]|uniref:J domain-containing protein n=1 Tax=Schistocephalus solidus TaxID=70667 RepID=A0A183SE78_SCHSO|nr:unnamed protein product [Schistocephalus solidus]
MRRAYNLELAKSLLANVTTSTMRCCLSSSTGRGPCLYQILGITPYASQKEIRSAYYSKCKETHPDAQVSCCGSKPPAASQFHLVSHAYSVLGNPQLRHIYDLECGQTANFNPTSKSPLKDEFFSSTPYGHGISFAEASRIFNRRRRRSYSPDFDSPFAQPSASPPPQWRQRQERFRETPSSRTETEINPDQPHCLDRAVILGYVSIWCSLVAGLAYDCYFRPSTTSDEVVQIFSQEETKADCDGPSRQRSECAAENLAPTWFQPTNRVSPNSRLYVTLGRPNQAGFRAGRGPHIHSEAHSGIPSWLPAVVYFIDFAAAFDSLHRESLWRIMELDGVPAKIIALIKAYYRSTTARVLIHNKQYSQDISGHPRKTTEVI